MAEYEVTRLPSGLRVATARMTGVESACLGVWAGVGARFEEARDSGAAHFLEHLLFKGTPRRTARRISEAVEGIGGDLNAMTGEESTCYYAKALARHLPRLLDVLLDMFLNASLPPDEVERERGVIREEILMYFDQPSQHVQELLTFEMWPDQALGRPITGSVETVEAMSRTRLLQFRNTHYRPANTVIVAAGHVDHADLVQRVERAMGRQRSGSASACEPARERQRALRVKVARRPTEQAHVAMGLRALPRTDPRRFALRLLSVVLGENMSSRLFQQIRERRGWAYSVGSSVAQFRDTGVLNISAGMESKRVGQVLGLIGRELRRAAEQPVGRAELRRAKDYLIGTMWLGLENSSSQMQWVGESLLAFDTILKPETLSAEIEAVTAREVQQVAELLARAPRISVAVVAAELSEDEVHGALGLLV